MSAADFRRITVIGAGAVGGWVAARLALSGAQVMALSSSGPLDSIAIEESGASATAEFARFGGPADLLVIAVKAPALAKAVEAALPAIGPDTIVLPLLNGVPWWFTGEPLNSVDPGGAIAQMVPATRVLGSVVHAACHRTAPGQVVVTHADKILLGEPDGGTSERVAQIFALLERAGLKPDSTANIRRAIWYKLWGNATINPLCALTRATADKLLFDPPIRAFLLEAMAELAAVGAAIGCPITESGEDRMAVTARLGAFKPSMLQDVEAGRPIELEALLGAPREIAARAGVQTPQLDRIYAMTRLMGESLNLL